MLELKQTGKNWFNIVDDGDNFVSGTKEELKELCQQIDRIEDEVPQKKEELHIVLLEDDYNDEKVQMELSDSAYRLLSYLCNREWLRSNNVHFTKIDEIDFKKFI